MKPKKLDIGCGPHKEDGFIGMDIYRYKGVDIVWNINKIPWPIEDDSFEYIQANQVIEHIHDLFGFFKEIHRISENGAILHIETPHYSSRNSWADPTHVQHLSAYFCRPFIDGYLSEQIGRFEIINRRVIFGSLWHTWKGRILAKFLGVETWENYYSFRHPARFIVIDLRVVK